MSTPVDPPVRPAAAHEHAALGRVVRWDAAADSGAVVVEGLAVEVAVPPGAATQELQPGDLVELVYVAAGAQLRALRARPTDG